MYPKTYLLAAVSLLSTAVVAQTPSGFTPQQRESLGLAFGSNTVSPAGELIPRAETASPPTLNTIALGQSTTGLALMVDLDVRSSSGDGIGLIHWLAPGIRPDLSSPNGATLQVPSSSSGGVSYRQPTPPAGDSPHRYVVLLFTQPNDYSLPSQYSNLESTRTNFNYRQFITDLRLGDPLAANYFTVQNTTGAASGSASASGASSASSTGSAASAASSASSRVSSALSSITGAASSAASSARSAVATATANAAAVVKGQAMLGLAAAGAFALL